METNKNAGAAECGDCNTCGKCEEQLEITPELQGFNDAVRAAASHDYNSYEKNLARQRRATLDTDAAQGMQVESFSRNAVMR